MNIFSETIEIKEVLEIKYFLNIQKIQQKIMLEDQNEIF